MRISEHPVLDFSNAGKPEVSFTFDGRRLGARAGETIAAALLANDILVFRLSPKLREPRSVFCLQGRCGECLLRVNGQENVCACQTLVEEGLVVESNLTSPG